MKRISTFPGIVLEISIDAVIACCLWWDGYLKVHCRSHDSCGYQYKSHSAWLNPVIEEEISCKREIGNAHDTHAVAVRNIIDEDIEAVGRVPPAQNICTG